MRCQWCGVDVFLCKFKQVPKYEIRRGWRNYFFCSSECRAKFREHR
jgi:YHS domain-containing protein